MIAIDAPPEVVPDAWTFPAAYLEDVRKMIDWHVNNPDESLFDGEDGELSVVYPYATSIGSVPKHTDEFDGLAARGKRIFGLVVENTGGHMLHSEKAPEGQPLPVGAFYSLDPHDPHWTTCEVPDARLTFIVVFMGVEDPRYGVQQRVAHDLFWESLPALMSEKQRIEKEREAYHGIQSIDAKLMKEAFEND